MKTSREEYDKHMHEVLLWAERLLDAGKYEKAERVFAAYDRLETFKGGEKWQRNMKD